MALVRAATPTPATRATDDFTGELANVSVPTLLTWGDRDTYTLRAAQDRLLQVVPGARFIIYEGYGHAFHWEDPTRFAADLVAFVAPEEQANIH
jgi:non-heme chloroperoxidase